MMIMMMMMMSSVFGLWSVVGIVVVVPTYFRFCLLCCAVLCLVVIFLCQDAFIDCLVLFLSAYLRLSGGAVTSWLASPDRAVRV